MSNKVLITNDQNVVKVPSGLRILIRRSCNAVLDFEHFDGPAEISVTFVDNNRIHELNKEYRDKDSATDVLSFPLGEDGEYDIDEDNGCKLLGDIVISMERAMEQAELYGHSLQREVAYLTVHSMLHLLGYDHEAGGLEAVLVQGGVNLSGGQRQRLSLARALVRGGAVLVLDDCTSALDPATERRVLDGLERRPGQAVLHITQKVRAARTADRILVLEEGRQVGLGTHRSLLDTCPTYREIWASQAPEEEGEDGTR